MSGKSEQQITTRLFVGAIVIAGGGALLSSLYLLWANPIPHEWMYLAALTLLSFFLAVKVPGIPVKLSVSETFVFVSVLLFGTAAATVIVALDALILSGWRHRHDPVKLLFNAAEPTLSIWVASNVFFALIGQPLSTSPRDATELLLPVVLLSLTYFLLNASLTAIAIWLQSGPSAIDILRGHFFWIALNYLGGASAALLIVQNSTTLSPTNLSIVLPLLVITYLTFKSSMGRIEDANRHLEHLNQMYMSTIETLAMAVDAKDQTTHGHIRRVQNHAVVLAKALGIHDVGLIKAIEAAALLHDIGKLGVPEHILNKPGTLNTSEFQLMKSHAALGADILSATEFPYPVIPIVRHHHENWDGTGYPDGLAGVEIPIGARVLAVVDCFDAVTSDRPYRRRLSRREALKILQLRRGHMYDPLVVDTFVKFIDEIVPMNSSEMADTFDADHDRRASSPTNQAEHRTINLLDIREASINSSFLHAATEIGHEINRSIPDTTYVVFKYDFRAKQLVPIHASDYLGSEIRRLRIPFAQQLSGWVAANRETVVNSDPWLDLLDASRGLGLRHALCTPIASGTVLFGVLSLYRKSDTAFTHAETSSAESLGRSLSAKLASCIAHSDELLGAGDKTLRDQ